jgi:DNA-binding response OmpR family regulator
MTRDIGDAASAGTVLLVDGEEMFRVAIGEALRRRGFFVLLAGSGVPAVELFEAHADEIAAVVLDLGIREIRSGEVLRRIREIRKNIRAVLTGALAPLDGEHDGAAFLRKPYRVGELVGKLQLLDPGGGARTERRRVRKKFPQVD